MNETREGENREAVGLFADRESFEATVEALEGAGFGRAELSVLGAHESLGGRHHPRRGGHG